MIINHKMHEQGHTIYLFIYLFVIHSSKSFHHFVSIATSVLYSITSFSTLYASYAFVADQSEMRNFVEYKKSCFFPMIKREFAFLLVAYSYSKKVKAANPSLCVTDVEILLTHFPQLLYSENIKR